jgi:hypothetical protein
MRNVNDHQGIAKQPTVTVLDEPAVGETLSRIYQFKHSSGSSILHFADRDHEGVTNESVLAVLIDRLRSAQAGPTGCREYAMALLKMEEAMMWLHRKSAPVAAQAK